MCKIRVVASKETSVSAFVLRSLVTPRHVTNTRSQSGGAPLQLVVCIKLWSVVVVNFFVSAWQCDHNGTSYDPCVSPCPPETCDNFLLRDTDKLCKKLVCVEGIIVHNPSIFCLNSSIVILGCSPVKCQDGYVQKSVQEPECIRKSECKPLCMTVGNKTYYEGDLMEENGCKKWYSNDILENLEIANFICLSFCTIHFSSLCYNLNPIYRALSCS